MALPGIVFASGNRHKYLEMRSLLASAGVGLVFGMDLAGLEGIPAVDENRDTYAGNAVLKAMAWAKALGRSVLADDSGIEVRTLGWGPGVKSARVAPDDGARVQWLLEKMKGISDREARFVAVLAFFDVERGRWYLAEGFCHGRIALEPSGRSGFGYDPIFVPRGFDETLATLGPDVKSRVSHRSVAAGALCRMLSGGCVVE